MKRKLTYEERVKWFIQNYYETGMEYECLLESMKDDDLDNIKWYDEIISIPEYEEIKEQIICAAIHFDDGKEHVHQPINIDKGFVVCGHRHHNCYYTLKMSYMDDLSKAQKFPDIEGFLTNTNRFVDRIEGLEIALRENQVLDVSELRGKRLFSEDLY